LARGRFRSLSVSEAVYNKLREIAERRGFSTLADTVAYLVSLEELVARRLESITGNTGNITTSTGNITASTGNVTTNAGNVKPGSAAAGESYEWCRPRSSIRSLQGFLEWADGRFGLLDWWEEDGKICLATRRKPVKTE